jgi:hypothetical protein
MRVTTNFLTLFAAITLASGLSAQTPVDPAIATAASPKGPMIALHLDNAEVDSVKGAPFCATITTQHTQAFSDGNRIHTSDKSSVCRDSEGRTRREAGLNLMGASTQKSSGKLITILDPVAGVRYILEPDAKVAHKVTLPSPAPLAPRLRGLPGKEPPVMIYQSEGGGGAHGVSTNVFFKKTSDAKESVPSAQDLGDQTINGIHATGTRMTTTIPSGQIGNDQPINIVSERWYSPELKTTVMDKHSDPMAGELKTELSGVNTSEPDPSLFTVPADYKIVEDKDGPMMLMRPPAPPPQ